MKAPAPFSPRRAFNPGRHQPRSGPGAAVALVRVEFERARHRRELDRLRHRAAVSVRALETLDERASALCAGIAGSDEDRR